jgi:PKD repeat protein
VDAVKLVRRTLLSFCLLLSMLVVPLVAVNNGSSWAAGGPTAPQNQLVSAIPATGTPNVLDGEVLTFAQVGSTMVAGGTFSQVQPSSGSPTYSRPSIVAFDATTGAISTAFAPNLNGQVDALLAGPVPGTVYVGGMFTTDNGVAVPNLLLLNVSDGSRVAGFVPGAITKGVMAIRLLGSQLIIGGNFTAVGATPRGGLASLNPATGALTSLLTTSVTGHHNFGHVSAAELAAINFPGVHVAKGLTGVVRIAINPQGTRMVVIGNFDTVGGLARDQIAVFNLTSTSASIDPNWKTNRFSDACFWFTFDSWIRDVDFSPDGSYFAVATAGGHDFLLPEAATTCDTITRWETSASGQDLQPTWVASSGSDSFFSVAITGPVIYGAGHPRWLNNPLASDNKGAGASPRPGIVALDPANGMPFAWNPGREPRGHGTQGMLATPAGLWIGSDTDWIGNQQYLRRKIAFFPLAGGSSPAPNTITPLPADVYLGTPAADPGQSLVARPYDGTRTGVDAAVASGIDWTTMRATMLVGGNLFYTKTGSTMLWSRTFDGTTFGSETAVNPYSIPYWNNVVDSGRGTNGILTLQGLPPDLYAQLPSVTSMAFDPSTGRMYYTLTGDPALYYRAFTADDGIIGAIPATMTGVSMAQTSGMFISGGQLYFASSTGTLSSVGLGSTGFTGAATAISGPGLDGTNWASGSMFAGPLTAPVQAGPAASFTSSCTLLACTFDASGSSDTGGTITSYAWDFGDGSTGTGVTSSHTFGSAGPQSVTLTVTDSAAKTAKMSHTVTVSGTSTPAAAFTVNCNQLACSFDASGSTDSGGTLTSYAWDFGDTGTGSGLTPSHTYAASGPYIVGLTVTDNLSQTSTVTHSVTVTAAVHAIGFVGAAQTTANAANETVTVPPAVTAGNALVLVASSASSTAPVAPAGWTQVASVPAGTSVTTTVWSKVATSSDAGSSVTVSYGALHKGSLQVLAYSGTDLTTPVQTVTTAAKSTAGTSETTPKATVSGSASWVVSLWQAKSSTVTAFTAPGGQAVRSTALGTGSGQIDSLATDSGGPVPAGPYGGLVAGLNSSAGSATMVTLVLAAA